MLAGVLSFAFGRRAKQITLAVTGLSVLLSAGVLAHTLSTGASFTYWMGHFPAPWGNELRAGPLEGMLALLFTGVMLLSLLGGLEDLARDVPLRKQGLYFVMMNLLNAALLAVTYTNDLFTAYVFIDIITIGACSVVMSKPGGKTLIATMLYLIMSLIGSSLVLLSISLLYGITGHLLLEPLHGAVQALVASGEYLVPLFVMFALLCVGLGIKAALFPFHVWLPGAHANSTTASSCVLSGIVLKCYLFFIIKMVCRVLGRETAGMIHINDVLLVFGLSGMVFGSLGAMGQGNIKRMLSYASVAQVSYICVGIGLNTAFGLVAAMFHLIAHACAKPMLFMAAGGLSQVSGHSKELSDLRGAARRAPLAGVAFACGAFAMVGLPFFSGFVSKLYLTTGALGTPFAGPVALVVISLGTVLSAMYYLPAVVCLFARTPGQVPSSGRVCPSRQIALGVFLALNLALGVASQPVIAALEAGFAVFG